MRRARVWAAAALALSLGACVSLLPKSKPAQLYRFGASAAAPAGPDAGASSEKVAVFWGGATFPQEAEGDRILTITGEHAAFVAGARWVAPAQVLFDQAVAQAFERPGGHVRLVPRGVPSSSDYLLRLDVRNFETRYDNGPDSAPIVVVRLHAVIVRTRNAVSEQVFEARIPASDNRVSAIVAAYDKALGQTLGQVVAWTNQTAA